VSGSLRAVTSSTQKPTHFLCNATKAPMDGLHGGLEVINAVGGSGEGVCEGGGVGDGRVGVIPWVRGRQGGSK